MSVTFARLTESEFEAVGRIVGRAQGMSPYEIDRMTLRMDLTAVHAQIPLQLEDLAEADDFNFSHDVFGIMRHIDRETGELGGCFVPRYARRGERP